MNKKYIFIALAAVAVYFLWKKKQSSIVAAVIFKPGDAGYVAAKAAEQMQKVS